MASFCRSRILLWQGLAQGEDGAATKFLEYDLLGVLLAHLGLGVVVGAGVAQRDLQVGVGHLAVGHHGEILEDLHVALVGVEDYVEVLVGAKHLGQHVAERFLEHADHSGLVDVLEFLELGKLLDHIGGSLFLSHGYVVFLI